MSAKRCECGNEARFLCDFRLKPTREQALDLFKRGERVNGATVTCDALRSERRANERQAQIDERLGCRHPLTVDEDGPDMAHIRVCVGCGLDYDRSEVIAGLREAIRARRRLPSSPYTGAERSEDPS